MNRLLQVDSVSILACQANTTPGAFTTDIQKTWLVEFLRSSILDMFLVARAGTGIIGCRKSS
jgi:hypothetical protein